MSAEVQNAGTVVLLEATAEARTLIEDLSRLGEELRARQERLGELLAPSEAALRARTEYLDKVIREELSRAEERILRLSEDADRIGRSLNDQMVHMPARLAEADARRWDKREKSERRRMVVSLLAMLLGGFLAGQVASYRSGATANTRPVAVEQTSPGSKMSTPSAPRRPAGASAKPNAAPAAR